MANRQIGVLWSRKSQNGTQYMSGVVSMGVFGECQIVVFKSTDKRSESSPDFIMYASSPQRQNGTTTGNDELTADDKDLPF
jgi:hypothetical protein